MMCASDETAGERAPGIGFLMPVRNNLKNHKGFPMVAKFLSPHCPLPLFSNKRLKV